MFPACGPTRALAARAKECRKMLWTVFVLLVILWLPGL